MGVHVTKRAMVASALFAAATSAVAAPPQLLLLGSYHLANNNRDLVNVPIEDVLAPDRQREIEALVTAIAGWKPTRVAVEWPRSDQAGLDRRYSDFLSGRTKPTANEREQIAFRLAARLKLPRVEAIDWNEAPPGPETAYAFDEWAKAHGQQARFEAFVSAGQRRANEQASAMRCTSVAQWYRVLNTPAQRREMNRPYFEIATFGDNTANPGAAWVGAWYARNLRIFNNLHDVSKPGERVFVLYGAGHAYLLDLFARDSGAFTMVDPVRYLPASAGARRCK